METAGASGDFLGDPGLGDPDLGSELQRTPGPPTGETLTGSDVTQALQASPSIHSGSPEHLEAL